MKENIRKYTSKKSFLINLLVNCFFVGNPLINQFNPCYSLKTSFLLLPAAFVLFCFLSSSPVFLVLSPSCDLMKAKTVIFIFLVLLLTVSDYTWLAIVFSC